MIGAEHWVGTPPGEQMAFGNALNIITAPAFGAVGELLSPAAADATVAAESLTSTTGIQIASGGQETVAATQNGILLGTVENGQVKLFQTAAGQIEGHADLVNAGLVSPNAQGFSIAVKYGQVIAGVL